MYKIVLYFIFCVHFFYITPEPFFVGKDVAVALGYVNRIGYKNRPYIWSIFLLKCSFINERIFMKYNKTNEAKREILCNLADCMSQISCIFGKLSNSDLPELEELIYCFRK